MSSNVIEGRSVVLRLEFSIADAVRHRGLGVVLGEALRAWWAQRPIHYSDVPDYLREDVGLPAAQAPNYLGIGIDVWRTHPPDRSWP
ncbi:hypothetical protein [Devosia elaeis]|uniref:Uncharacterized protein n=1 Tax=Devosia elaeis TaxID=1770058 RepID=A0A178HWP5_9HYPH|nr:hypothetical protein [Devosia elaeis]OAM76474.1 hypothetical protein A3840_12480 [Devosia elaeis]